MTNKLFNAICAGALFGAAHGISIPVEAKPKVDYFTMDATGCMILRECTDNVRRINSIDDIKKNYPDSNFEFVAEEFNSMLVSLNKVGVMVFLGDEKYFPPGHRGVYHTVSNNFFLNERFMHRPNVLMTVMRHEGWHAAQDCMAGSIKNSLIAIIKPEEDVPQIWRDMVEKSYPKSAVPWEAEAKWAGLTEGMTAKALEACAAGKMWEVYEPTPLTRKWLVENNYLPK
jgi:hypothetical protein